MTIELPETCPLPLAELINAAGGREAAGKIVRAGGNTLSQVIRGERPMLPEWGQRIEEYFAGVKNEGGDGGSQPEGISLEALAASPEFVPWDGTRRTVTPIAKKGSKSKPVKNVPTPLADLIEKHKGNLTAAAKAMGYQALTSIYPVLKGTRKFDEKQQRRVYEALHGNAAVFGREPDRYSLDMAIVQLQAKNYDRVNDIAGLLNGRIIFRMNTSSGWLIIYRLKSEDARKFKRIALRDSQKIVCP